MLCGNILLSDAMVRFGFKVIDHLGTLNVICLMYLGESFFHVQIGFRHELGLELGLALRNCFAQLECISSVVLRRLFNV